MYSSHLYSPSKIGQNEKDFITASSHDAQMKTQKRQSEQRKESAHFRTGK